MTREIRFESVSGNAPRSWFRSTAAALTLIAAIPSRAEAGAPATGSPPEEAVLDLSLEDLLQVTVTSVSKKAQRLGDTSAGVYVITQEDIRRSGATCIPEALRLAPGVDAAQIDNGRWAVSIRGFNGRFANKLLVLLDGRTLYSALFSGVIWESVDTLLEDIERIEVIRGPGASVWGSNAVNGVINIITRSAKDTAGGLVAAAAGTRDRASGAVRYGLAAGGAGNLRAFVKGFSRGASPTASGADGTDDWRSTRAGLRWDIERGADRWTLQGDLIDGDLGTTLESPILAAPYVDQKDLTETISGGAVIGRWQRALGPGSDLSVQAYLERGTLDYPGVIKARTGTADVEFQHHFAAGTRHDVIWGVGYRHYEDDVQGSEFIDMAPEATLRRVSAFVQDEAELASRRLRLTVGARAEHNDYTGWEFQPNVRLLWNVRADQTAWFALSRAVRTPARAERDVRLRVAVVPPFVPPNASPFPLEVAIQGNAELHAEELRALDAGYRAQLGTGVSLDVAAFYNVYDRLLEQSPEAPGFDPGPPPSVTQMLTTVNGGERRFEGAELALDWRPGGSWRTQLAYSWLSQDKEDDPTLPRSATHRVSLRSGLDVGAKTEMDLWLRYVGESVTGRTIRIPAYTTLDLRLAWRPHPRLALSLSGQNLLDESHGEFVTEFLAAPPLEVPRTVSAKIEWTF